MTSSYDLVIRGGTLIDGTGGDPKSADLALKDGVIAAIGTNLGRGREEINAAGKLVTPGFVDIHTHYDGQITWESRLKPSSAHGVTSVVVGNCGVGFAPCKRDEHELLIRLMEGVEDIPHPVLVEGLPWTWESYPEYLDTVARRSFDVDVGTYVPHAALRVFVMGERGTNREPATAADRAQMAALLDEAIKAGALGIGTSRTVFHRSSDGKLIPTLEAEETELQAFAQVLGAAKAGTMQIVSDFRDPQSEFAMLKRLAETSRRPVTFTLGEGQGTMFETWKTLLAETGQANREGLTIKPQILGRPIGMLLGFEMTLNPFCTVASYDALSKLPFAKRIEALRSPELRARLLSEKPDENPKSTLAKLVRLFDRMFELGETPDYEPLLENSIAARAAKLGIRAEELAYDLMLKRDGHAMLYLAIGNYAQGNLDTSYHMLQHPDTVLGLGDGGAHCATICDASYSTYALMHWGRDRTRGPRLPLPLLVKSMTRETARIVGFFDRGVLAPGYKADINVIDFDKLRLHAPELSYDLPSGGKRLVQKTDGYSATIVNGIPVYRDGEPCGPLPGRLVRGGQPAPQL